MVVARARWNLGAVIVAAAMAACGDDAAEGEGGARGETIAVVSAGDPVSGPASTGTPSSSSGGPTGDGGALAGGSSTGVEASTGEGGAGGDGGSTPGPWTCVGDVTWPPPEKETLRVQMVLVNQIIDLSTLGDLPVRFCRRDDLACDNPVDEVIADENGYVDAEVPITDGVGFDGYFEVGPGLANGDTEVPVNVVMTVRPWTNDYGSSGNTPQGVITAGVLGALLDGFAITPLEGRGHVGVLAKDCLDDDAAGIVPEAPDGGDDARVLYLANGVSPDEEATATDDSGVAAIANVDAGRRAIVASLENGEIIGESDVIVRDGGVTIIGIGPTPLDD